MQYAAAIGCVLIGILSRMVLEPVLGIGLVYLTLYPAVAVAAFIGGFGPGMLAAVLSAVVAQTLWSEDGGGMLDALREVP